MVVPWAIWLIGIVTVGLALSAFLTKDEDKRYKLFCMASVTLLPYAIAMCNLLTNFIIIALIFYFILIIMSIKYERYSF